jgi:ComEC/Rec2-related protein
MPAQNDRYIDKPFNLRPICFWAFFMFVTIVVCFISREVGFWLVLVWFAVMVVVFAVVKRIKARDEILLFLKRSKIFMFVTFALCIMVTAVFFATTAAYTGAKSFEGIGEISGAVTSYGTTRNGYFRMIISDVGFDGEYVSGRVVVYVDEPEDLTENLFTACRVSFLAELRNADADDFNINNRIKYIANADEVTVTGADNSLRSIISRESKNFLARFLNEQNLELIHSMLFGDKSALDGEIEDGFAFTGLIHALSVSGLHVSLIAAMLVSLLKISRISRKKQVPIIAIALLFYCYLCDFQFPVLRAAIMFMVFLVNKVYLRSSDSLSSLCMAAIVILLLFPYSLMSASFQLSFACMFGLVMFSLPIKTVLSKVIKSQNKVSEYIKDGLAAYLAVHIACMPLFFIYFGYFSIIGIFANIVILPVLILCFQMSAIALVTVFAYPLLYICDWLLSLSIWAITALGDLPYAGVYVPADGYFYLFYFLGLIVLSRFVFAKRRFKTIAAIVLIGIYVLSLMF